MKPGRFTLVREAGVTSTVGAVARADVLPATRNVTCGVSAAGSGAERRVGLRIALVVFATFAIVTLPLTAQQPVPAGDPLAAVRETLPADHESARRALSGALWQAIAAVERSEFALAQSLDDPNPNGDSEADRALYEQINDDRLLLVALLDTVILKTAWGADELDQLRRRYPGSPLFLRYEAQLNRQRGDHEAALDAFTRLLDQQPSDADLHAERARELEALGRMSEAIRAFTRAFDLEPENVEIFRALVRLREEAGTLPTLLEQVKRLRILYSDISALTEYEIEILHRLGRLEEAEAAARLSPEDTQ